MNAAARLIIFVGRAGDRNELGAPGAEMLGDYISARRGLAASRIGTPNAPLNADWSVELLTAQPDLRLLADALSKAFDCGMATLTTMGRCAAGLATLPVVARHYPDAAVVWFDAHGDSNIPGRSTTGYLGGMVLSGASGLWDSGLGSGLSLENIVFVGCRDLDLYERELIDDGTLTCVRAGSGLLEALRDAIGQRRVYVHLDCDVMEPGLLPTEYRAPGGLSFEDLRAACDVLAMNDVLGVEVAELQSRWPNGEAADVRQLFDAIAPLIGDSGPSV